MLRIGYLADHPEFIPVIAEWYFREWGKYRAGDSVERRIGRLTEAANRRAVPTVIVAYEGDRILGSAMLVACDMESRKELSPWVAGVFVEAAERGKGIGAALVERVIEEAKALGFPWLYLFTFSTEEYYARLGWEVVERTEYLGAGVTVMRWDLLSDEEILRRDAEMENGKVAPMIHEEFVRRVREGRKRPPGG
ncbi:MAG TPA: GNAT family N-acetyltransferase [Verrucomicrobiae bacterium]